MMTGEELKLLEEFSFGDLLRKVKAETQLNFKQIAELSGIPYKDLYKYARCKHLKPNLVEFYKFMNYLETSADEFLLEIIGRDTEIAEIRHYAAQLKPLEKELLDQLAKLDETQRNQFINKTLPVLERLIKNK